MNLQVTQHLHNFKVHHVTPTLHYDMVICSKHAREIQQISLWDIAGRATLGIATVGKCADGDANRYVRLCRADHA